MSVDVAPALPALVTPLTPAREVDPSDVAHLVRRALDDGAGGVVVAGTTGEGALLEPAQRVLLTRTARAAAGGARVVAGAYGLTPAALHDDVAALAAAGADQVLVLAPHTYRLSPSELVELHLEVAERSPVPTLVYHVPQVTGSALTPEVLPELAAHPNVVGMKDSSDDPDRRARFVATAGEATEAFEVLTGHAPTLRAALEAGAAGSITAIANVRLRQVLALHRAVADGDGDAAAARQAALTRTGTSLGRLTESLPAVLKAVLQLDGVVTERWCRPPLASVPPARLDHVRSALLR